MADKPEPASSISPVKGAGDSLIVVRSEVTPETDYRRYRQPLRNDFWFSCAYCTMCESEGGGVRFTIDHYEPRNARPDLEAIYSNLFYACDGCNERKGDRCPPSSARAEGKRFFRCDEENRSAHFQQQGILLEAKEGSKVGQFTIDAVDLNRKELQKLRAMRKRLWEVERAISEGVRTASNQAISVSLRPGVAVHFAAFDEERAKSEVNVTRQPEPRVQRANSPSEAQSVYALAAQLFPILRDMLEGLENLRVSASNSKACFGL